MSSTGTGNAYAAGVTGNGTSQGDLLFTVPSDAPDQLFYNCQNHSPMNGIFTIEGTVGGITNDDALPVTFGLYGIFPNPFNPAATILYDLPKAAMVRLTVFDMVGRQVAVLVDGRQMAGAYTQQWDGTDMAGQPVGSGVYIARLQAGQGAIMRKMVLLR